MNRIILLYMLLLVSSLGAQVTLHLDSSLRKAYEKRYGYSDGFMCVPFYCDPFYEGFYKKSDTAGLCGKYVFVDRSFRVKVGPVFDMPCWFEPRFSEGLAAVSIHGQIVFVDTFGQPRIRTGLASCSPQKNKVSPFRNGRARVLQGGHTLKHYYRVYYIDRSGQRLTERVSVRVRPRRKPDQPVLVVKPEQILPPPPVFEVPKVYVRGKYPLEAEAARRMLSEKPHRNNRMLVNFDCGPYQAEHMDIRDTGLCGRFVFTDTLFNIRIGGGFKLPCAFEPEFSEGLCAVAVDSTIVYIDTSGRIVFNTGLKACGPENNKASTFRNGIATLYQGDPLIRGLYKTQAVNTRGERVRLLEYDDLETAESQTEKFSNLTAEEAVNCFVGRGKSNGIWFLIEKSGKVRKKLERKSD